MADTTTKSLTTDYVNETFSGCDMTASITIKNGTKSYTRVLGELQTVSYSIHMEKRPVRSIGNVNAKDYVMGQRTIAGSLVFSVFNKHFAQDLMENINKDNSVGTVFLVDELPPFDLVITAANEYGYRSKLVIYGIRLLNEGQVMSVNDVFTENTYQYFATDLEYLTDEMYYTRSSSDKLYKLNDSIPYYDTTSSNIWIDADRYKTEQEKQEEYWTNLAAENITLSYAIKTPTRSGGSIVTFYLNPGQSEGIIYVNNSDDDLTKISIKADTSSDAHNLQTSASKKFDPDTYTAYFKSTSGNKSNTIKFKVNQYTASGNIKTTVPTLSAITSKSVTVHTISSKHDKVYLLTDNGGDYSNYNIKSKKCKITGLDENTMYYIRTYCSSDPEDTSATVSFKTLSTYEAYTNLITYIKTNKTSLGISDITEYKALIEESEDPDLTPAQAIDKLKTSYKTKLACLDLGSATYKTDKVTYETKISECSTILTIAQKINNDTTIAINQKLNVPAPTWFYDENYDHIFQFDDNIESAEFFRVYDVVEQYATTINANTFKTIDNKTNCARFTGKPGVTHYVQAVTGNVRSAKVEFYIMTESEKQQYIAQQSAKSTLSSNDVSKLDATVNNDLSGTVSTLDEQRAFMYNAKKISNNKVMAPVVIAIETDITIETFLNNFVNNPNAFYLAIADYNDIVNNNDIYKIPFTCKDKNIIISALYNGIKENTAYAIWIEDSNNNQISNATTFSYIPGTEVSDDITAYEVSSLISTINSIAKTNLSTDVQSTIKGTIENNQSITSNEIISSAIDIVTTNIMDKSNMLNFLYKLQYYIGIFSDCDTSFISNITYNTSHIDFNCSGTGTILIYDLDQIKNINLGATNTIMLNDYDANVLVIVAIDNSFNSKSSVIVVDKSNKYMEVL